MLVPSPAQFARLNQWSHAWISTNPVHSLISALNKAHLSRMNNLFSSPKPTAPLNSEQSLPDPWSSIAGPFSVSQVPKIRPPSSVNNLFLLIYFILFSIFSVLCCECLAGSCNCLYWVLLHETDWFGRRTNPNSSLSYLHIRLPWDWNTRHGLSILV